MTVAAQSPSSGGTAQLEADRVRVTIAPDGAFDLMVRAGDGAWMRVHSRRSPEAEASSQIDREIGVTVPPLVGVIGAGLGYIVDELFRRRADVRIIVMDVPELVAAWRRRRDPAPWQASGQLVIGAAPGFEVPSASWPSSALASDPPLLVNPVIRRAFPAIVERAVRSLRQLVFERRANEEARQRLAPMFLEHTLKNLPAVIAAPDVSMLDRVAEGDPLVLCGAGPSLDRLLPALKANRGRAWYVALDTSLRPLLAAGIVPDLVVSIDPTPLNGRHLLDLPTRARPWLAAEASVDPRAWSAFRGKACVLRVNRADPWPWLETIGVQPTRVRAWGSVLTAACDVILRMKPAGVAFAGVDLAYTNGQPYCRGTAFEQDWEAERQAKGFESVEAVWKTRLDQRRTIHEAGIDGEPVLTASHLVAFRNWVRSLAADTPSCAFVNVTGSGILHGGSIEQVALTAWLDKWPSPTIETESRLASAAVTVTKARAHDLAGAIDAAATANGEPWTGWTTRMPGVNRAELQRELTHAARQLRAFRESVMNATQTDWIDVPYSEQNFVAQDSMQWTVPEGGVATYAYRLDGKSMTVAFKITRSTLSGYPASEVYLRLPAGAIVARGTANAVVIGTQAVKEIGYAIVHQGHDIVVVRRVTQAPFPLDDGCFYLFGQIVFEVQ